MDWYQAESETEKHTKRELSCRATQHNSGQLMIRQAPQKTAHDVLALERDRKRDHTSQKRWVQKRWECKNKRKKQRKKKEYIWSRGGRYLDFRSLFNTWHIMRKIPHECAPRQESEDMDNANRPYIWEYRKKKREKQKCRWKGKKDRRVIGMNRNESIETSK